MIESGHVNNLIAGTFKIVVVEWTYIAEDLQKEKKNQKVPSITGQESKI